MVEKGDPLGIVQRIEIWLCWQIVYAKTRICSRKSDLEISLQLWDTNRSPKFIHLIFFFFFPYQLFCHILKGHTGAVHSCQFFHADKYILSSSEDSTVKIWNTKTCECIHTFTDNQSLAILKVHVAPDDKRLVADNYFISARFLKINDFTIKHKIFNRF